MIDGTHCVAILITTNASDYQHGKENLCFYFTTKGCPIGTSFQRKLTNLCTCERALELGTGVENKASAALRTMYFFFVLAYKNMKAVKRADTVFHNPAEFILTTRIYLKTASER